MPRISLDLGPIQARLAKTTEPTGKGAARHALVKHAAADLAVLVMEVEALRSEVEGLPVCDPLARHLGGCGRGPDGSHRSAGPVADDSRQDTLEAIERRIARANASETSNGRAERDLDAMVLEVKRLKLEVAKLAGIYDATMAGLRIAQAHHRRTLTLEFVAHLRAAAAQRRKVDTGVCPGAAALESMAWEIENPEHYAEACAALGLSPKRTP